MTDDPVVPVVTDERSSAGGIQAFFASTTGRIVIIAVALVMLAVILGVVGTIIVGTLLNTSSEKPGAQTASKPPVTAPAKETSVTPAVPDVTVRDVFTPRNPFRPVFLPAEAVETTEGTEFRGDSDPNTLTLLQIVEEDGVRKGVFTIGKTKYTAGAGEQLGGTPWQVVSIGQSSAIMMFGDNQIVLTVGQGVFTK